MRLTDRETWARRIRALIHAIQENDEAAVQDAILRLSQTRKIFAPLGLAIGAFAMLFNALKLLVSNWRLTLVQVLPAMWIWLAMFDLKLHVMHGKQFNPLRGWVLIPLNLVIVGITIGAFFLNAVFAFAISQDGKPEVRPAMIKARSRIRSIAAWGTVVGLMLGFSTTIVTRWGRPWFTIALGIVIGVMMVCYVAVPSALLGGVKPEYSRRDKLATAAVGGALSAAVSAPGYLMGRIGLLMLGTKLLFIPGIFLLAAGITFQAGATGAVRAIKMSVKLTDARAAGAPEGTRPPGASAPARATPPR
jgi:hypothetical protein